MGETLYERAKRTFENTFHPAHAVAGICSSPTLEQVQDLLEHAENITNRAKTAADFANSVDALGEAGEKLAVGVKKLHGLTEKGANVAGDVKAACEISDAMSVLSDWSMPESKVSSAEAAKAFDQLFGGAARYFKKLPPPVNAYAQVLEEIARVSFFSNMEDLMNPAGSRTPRGRQMQQALDSIDHAN